MSFKLNLRILFMLPLSCWLLLAEKDVLGDEKSKAPNDVKGAIDSFELQNQEKILLAEQDLEKAREDEQKLDFGAAIEKTEKARTIVAALNGPYAQSKLRNIDQYMKALKASWADKLMADARRAFVAKNYDFAVSQAQKAAKIDSDKQRDADALVKTAQQKLRYNSIKANTDINKLDPGYENNKKEIAILLKEAEIFSKNKMYGKSRDTLEKILIKDPYNAKATSMLNDVYQRLYEVGTQRRQVEYSDRMQQLEWGWNESFQPMDRSNKIQNPIARSADASTLQEKMQKIVFDNLEFEDASITSVISHLNTLSKQFDPDGTGVSIVSNLSNAQSAEIPRITMSFDHIPMGEAIRYICQNAGLKYKIEEKAVIIGDKSIDPMDTRFFKVRAALISSISGTSIDTEKMTDDRTKFTEKDHKTDLEDTFKTTTTTKKGGGGGAAKTTPAAKTEGGGATATAAVATNATSEALMKYFTDRGINFEEGATIAYDRRAGKLIVKNTYENLRKLEHLLRDLDIQTPLVLIEAKIVEMTQNDLEELGFDWVFSSTTATTDSHPHWQVDENSQILRHYSASNSNSSSSSDSSYKMLNGFKILPNFGGSGSDMNLDLTINAIDQHGRQEVLSAPKVIATSGTTALIKMVEMIFYPDSWSDPELSVSTSSIQVSPPTPEFGDATDIGIRFEVTPTVSPNNYTISLHLVPQVVAFSGWMTYPVYMSVGSVVIGNPNGDTSTDSKFNVNISMPIISRRDLDTNVKVFDGETIVLGGMLQDVAVARNDKWPFLADVPLLGRLFSSQMQQSEKVNLLIFVTARLINNDGVPVREDSLRGLPEFNR